MVTYHWCFWLHGRRTYNEMNNILTKNISYRYNTDFALCSFVWALTIPILQRIQRDALGLAIERRIPASKTIT